MKQILTSLFDTLLYPLLYCRQILLDASEICSRYDPMEYADCYSVPEPSTLFVSRNDRRSA